MNHQDRVCIVTGGASGIGRCIVEKFALEEKATVCLLDRNAESAHAVAESVRASGGTVHPYAVDLSNIAAIERVFSDLVAAVGGPQILINCAGFASVEAAATFNINNWRKSMDINVTAAMRLSQLCIATMREHRWGRIVNISSVSADLAGTGRLAYGTSKAALNAMTRQFSVEVAQDGITVNAVAPGPVQTSLTGENHGGSTADIYKSMIPMGRYGSMEEIAHAVSFLASTGASYLTGHTLPVDGGFLASGIIVRDLFNNA
ncbi:MULTISPECIES: SDR family NAD(P)-dependent oxidoreductase [unclassified Variovorax]|uniref:SDR family NAD(P)-dependent oxidoreductase n=1 Tax=unclassified Variovorax TaxID=663243 RepID=UPI003F48CF4E